MTAKKQSTAKTSKKSKSSKKSSSNKKTKSNSASFKNFFSNLSISSKLLKIIGIVLVILLLVLSISYFFGVKMKFMADNELYISLDPLDYSLKANNSDIVGINFSVNVNRPMVCETECEFSLVDESSGSIISSQSRSDFESESFSFDLNSPNLGEGQSLFNFKVACYNKRSSLCSSQERVFYKNALVTLNYDLSDDNLHKEDNSRNLLNSFLSDLVLIESNIDKSSFYISALDYPLQTNTSNISTTPNVFSEQTNLSSNLHSLNNSFNNILAIKNSVLSSWNDFDFDTVTSDINSASSDLNTLFLSSQYLLSDSNNSYFQLTNSINSINYFYSKESSLFEAKKFFTMVNDSSKLSQLTQLESDINNYLLFISEKNYSSIQSMFDVSINLKTRSDDFISNFRTQQNTLTNTLNSHTKLLFDVRNYLSDGFFPILAISPSQIQRVSFNFVCTDLSQEIQNVSNSNIAAQQQKELLYPYMNYSVLLSQASEEFIDYVINKKSSPSLFFSLNSSTYDNAPSDYPYTNSSGTFTTFNITSISENNFRLISKINVSHLTNDSYNEFCLWALPVSLVEFINISIPIIDSESNYSFSSIINTTLPLLSPVCDYNGTPGICCQGNSCDDSYPIVLVHGHSFDKANSPELAFTRLSLLQNSLEDLGYINAGPISFDSNIGSIPDGDWGRNPHPVSVLVTYYYITHKDVGGVQFTTRKTDSIENYAIRLKDMIDVVKQRTGSDKVIIIAHSMGGLVSREYIKLFGGYDVVKLITLGTPNLGIEGDVKKYCSVTGGESECEDMNFDSVFMSRLNSPSSTPQFTDVYTVTAHGCSMKNEAGDREDGDGVVLARNVPLSFATNYDINGTCTDFLNSNLHMKFVEPELYPETFEIIKSILTS